MDKNIVQDVVALSWLQREEKRNKEGSVTDGELKKYEAGKRYKAMEHIDNMHRELQKQIKVNIQRVDAQTKR